LYFYHVFASDTEIIAFHWHPGVTAFNGPHAHFRHLNHPFPMGKVHIPTGRTSLESVVRLLVEELGVAPPAPTGRLCCHAPSSTSPPPAPGTSPSERSLSPLDFSPSRRRHRSDRGSRASRRPSPTKLKPATVKVISSPGKSATHGAVPK